MYCQACGTQLPQQARACPNCGTFTTADTDNTSASLDGPTYVSASDPFLQARIAPPPPQSQYGSNPYGMPSQNSYPENAYRVPPPPPPTQRKVSLLLLGVLIIVLIIASVGFVYLRTNQASTIVVPTATISKVPTTGNAVANATATATAFYSLYDTTTGSGSPTLDDPLSNNSKGLHWDEGQGCAFTGGAYHVSNAQLTSFHVCMAQVSNFSNFLFQVQMTILKGSYGSLIFRSDNPTSNFYIFRAGQDGVCTFAVYKNNVNIELLHAPCLAFKQGPKQTNLLAVIAQGSHLIFYMNAQYVYDINDASFDSGKIGLVAGSIGDPTEVVYNNVKIWAL